MTEERPAKSITPPQTVRSGRAMGVAVLSLVLSGGALGAAGFLWWQQQQQLSADHARASELENSLAKADNELGATRQQLSQWATQQKQLQDQVSDLTSQRDAIAQKMEGLDLRIAKVVEGSARVDWMLAEVTQLVNVAERRLSLLGDVNGALALLESAETTVKAMEEPMARALRQALINDIQNLRSAQAEVIDTEGLLLRINSTKRLIEKLEPPRPNFQAEPVELPDDVKNSESGTGLAWYKTKKFFASLVRFQSHKQPLASIAVDPQARFYLQQGILLLLDQSQLAVLRGEATTYTLSLKEASDRVTRYLQADSKEGERVLRELSELSQQKVKQRVPEISETLLAADAFRQAWDKMRPAREAAAQSVHERAQDNPVKTDTKNNAVNEAGKSAAGRLP